jgi:hypothetical protein
MKTRQTLFGYIMAIVALAALALACNPVQPPLHEVRVKNSYPKTFASVIIGTAGFYKLRTGAITAYQHIPAGTQAVQGRCEPAGTLAGELTFSGNGIHQWTVVIAPSGYLTVLEDDQD